MEDQQFGDPWIFSKIIYFLQTGQKIEPVSLKDKFGLIKEHFLLEIEEKGEYTGVREFRKHLAAYTKSLPNSSNFRSKINTLEFKMDVINALDEYYNYLEGERNV